MTPPRLVVVARAPVPGRCKTRLCPPLTPAEAALVAEAALADTLEAVAGAASCRPLLALDGEPGDWFHPGFDLVAQRGGGLDERLAAAFEDAAGPAVVIGMDTPQVTSALLRRAVAVLSDPEVDAVLGPAVDGGWWALGLRRPDPNALLGVPMSTPWTGRFQQARLRALGLRVRGLPARRDVDRIGDALAVAAEAPASRFAAAMSSWARLQTRAGAAS